MEDCPSLEHCFSQRRSLDEEHSTLMEHFGGLIMNPPTASGMSGSKRNVEARQSFYGHYRLSEVHSTYLEACFTIETFAARTLGLRNVLCIWESLFLKEVSYRIMVET